ncbi:hypothetical protein [Anaeromyxobacter oryzae]|uniref:Lipoprotein n=1 Tax=Anaeromyxobacter oryzae TaxID=2918170 RepID=A0ABM7X1X5_9BACT|nr:hypothetical protein [Anaeromyxobacter oryzae]BDG05787.1 hypothetical protein AMOR_47830 [Anaeromyxobacter oryzae]
MDRISRSSALAPLLLVATLACGESRQAKLFHQIRSDCASAAANGWTLLQAEESFSGADVGSQVLLSETDIGTLDPDTCGTASATNPVGQVFWEWVATDTSLCNAAGGCCLICEVRVKKSDLDAKGTSAPICASRAAEGQVCQ